MTRIYYNGFTIIREGTGYRISGLKILSFSTLGIAKNRIDFMKLGKPHKTTAIHLN